jgi:hypothetical protein
MAGHHSGWDFSAKDNQKYSLMSVQQEPDGQVETVTKTYFPNGSSVVTDDRLFGVTANPTATPTSAPTQTPTKTTTAPTPAPTAAPTKSGKPAGWKHLRGNLGGAGGSFSAKPNPDENTVLLDATDAGGSSSGAGAMVYLQQAAKHG